MYKKLFELSKLSNTEICKRLDINHTERIQFEKVKKIDPDKFVTFSRKLGLEDKQTTELVISEMFSKKQL